ncbi:MAG: hypothetical protein AUH78_14820 [Gemmatimonadetes bacterium 13_1_40CM_4_69_8]|nr:MAG: hypothetical protein AUH78_14820 [Gemmatimonadetes bacterium 13_1_40CM_4_69_8]
MIDASAPPRPSIPGTAEPGWAELGEVLGELLADHGADEGPTELERLKSRVYRLRAGADGGARSFVLKRFDPWLARRNELVLQRWLPTLGLGACAPRLLATAAERYGRCVWHVYEDLGEGALDAAHPDPKPVAAVVDLIAQLHTRAAGHAVVPECRHYCGNLGAPFFVANLRDAIAVLEALAPPKVDPTPQQGALRGRLLGRLYQLRDDLPRRVHLLETLGGPDTLLHGDLWTTNTLVSPTARGLVARFIDWDHAAVGPVSYDLSTFLYRFPKPERWWILEAYRRAVAGAGWRLPPTGILNAVFETAEYARYANRIIWPAVALLEERAAWGFEQLAEVERWFDALELALPE